MHPLYRLSMPKAEPTPPTRFSHSVLIEIESCPRRWWLLNAHYEGLRGSYPQPIVPQAVTGMVVHGALASFAAVLKEAGNPIPGSPEFHAVRTSFPLRAIIQKLRRAVLMECAQNPRVDPVALEAATSVDACITTFKRLVSLAYTELGIYPGPAVPINTQHSGSKSVPRYVGLGTGSDTLPPAQARVLTPAAVPCPALLAEVNVEVGDLPFRGRIDLVLTATEGDTLVEFKTGRPKPDDEVQSRTHATIWWLWTRRPIRQRLLVYATHDPVTLGGLTAEEVAAEADSLRCRIASAQADLLRHPPPAKPNAENCRHCPVRQLCDEYWQAAETSGLRWAMESLPELPDELVPEEWRDLEVNLKGAKDLGQGFAVTGPVRLIATIPARLYPGSIHGHRRVRLLRVSLQRTGKVVNVVWSRYSEAYWSS